MTNRCAEITFFTKSGGALSKHIELIDGKIANDSSSCRMAKGSARRVRIDLGNMQAFAGLINAFGPQEAYAIGRLKHGLPDRVRVVPADKLNGEPDVIARTKTNIVFVEGRVVVWFCKTSTSKAYLRTPRAGIKDAPRAAMLGQPCAPSCVRSARRAPFHLARVTQQGDGRQAR